MGKTPALGDLCRDNITGFEGVVIAETKWLNGCVRLALQPSKLDKDGKPKASETFDIEQITVVKARKHEPMTPSGGPMPDVAAQRMTPGRR